MAAKVGPKGLPFDPMLNQIGQLDTHMEMRLFIEGVK
jgi:hypothetical protein